MCYKLIQIGYATFGTGETADDARNDAREWLDSPSDADGVPVYETAMELAGVVHGSLIIVSDDLAASMGDY